MIEIWTDGACLGNPGPAGCGMVVVDVATDTVIHKDSKPSTRAQTNNKAELMAIIMAFKYVQDNNITDKVTIVTDSEYSKNGLTKWRAGWIRKGYKDVKNSEFFKPLHQLQNKFPNVSVEWCKGHAGIKYNEMADALASAAARVSKQKITQR